jgi:hypothetical protein
VDDELYTLSLQHRYTTAEERAPYAERLRTYFASQGSPGRRTKPQPGE